MPKQISKMRNALIFMGFFFGVSSLSLSLLSIMPLLSVGEQMILGYGVAIAFWTGLIVGCIFLIRLELIRKELWKHGKRSPYRQSGIIAFRLDKPHLALYGGILLGLTLMVSDMMRHWISSYIMFPIISVTLFMFIIHCVIDGKNYRTYKFLKEGSNDGMACECKKD